MPLRLYLDEDVDVRLADALHRCGVDVITTRDANNLQLDDDGQLAFAAAAGRVILTHNIKHFVVVHTNLLARGEHHAGIAVARRRALGELLRLALNMVRSVSEADAGDALIYLEWFKEPWTLRPNPRARTLDSPGAQR